MIDHDLLPCFGEETPVEEISTRDVDALKDRCSAACRIAQPQKILVILHGVMARAKRKGWISANPCEDAEKVTVQRSDDFNVLSVEQVHAVAREATSALLRALFLTAAFTGTADGRAARTTLAAHRLREPDPARAAQLRRGRGGHAEEPPTAQRPDLRPSHGGARRAQPARSTSRPGRSRVLRCVGGHFDDNLVRDEFYAALERAGLGHLRFVEAPSEDNPKGDRRDEPIVFHDLRHTFGTQCAAKGIDMRKIQAWMGHADIQTTMRYMHYVPAHDERLSRSS